MSKAVSKQIQDQQRSEAVELLQQAMHRIKHPARNARGGTVQVGGAYWRLARVMKWYLEPRLVDQEGTEHAEFLLKTHGRVMP